MLAECTAPPAHDAQCRCRVAGLLLLLAAATVAPARAGSPAAAASRTAPAAAVAQSGQSLRRGVFGEPESLAPRESGVAGEQLILRDLFEGLTTFGPDARVVPGAAESWQVSADGLRYTFKLRPNLRWSDGAPLGAQDFVYGWQRALDPKTAAARATRLYVLRGAREVHAGRVAPAMLGVRAVDARTLIVEIEYPLPWLPTLLAGEEGFPLPRHAIDRYGNQWTRAGNMVSNGAFMLAERRVRGGMLVRRNPQFHAARVVQLDSVLFLPSDDTRGLANRFRAGELDVNSWPGFHPSQQKSLQQELGTQVHVVPLESIRFLRFNMRRAPFDDLRVRRALSMLVDRQVLVTRVVAGGERVSTRAVPEGIASALRPPPGELEAGTQAERQRQAREALVAAGFRARKPEPIRLRLPAGNGDEICIAIAAMWTAAGAPTRLEQSEIKSMIADLRRGDFDVALTGSQDPPAVEPYLERFRKGSSYNTGGYAGAEFERLLDSALRIADPQRRAAELQRAEIRLAADHAIVPLIQEVARNLVSSRVRGWVDNSPDIHLSRYLSLVQ